MILPDGRCDIILRYNAHTSDEPIPIITGPATQPYTVEYDVGDSWLGMRLRPDSAALLWQQRINHAADIVILGQDATTLVPKLAGLKRANLSLQKLALVLDIKSPQNTERRITRALDTLHASGGCMRIEKLATFVGCTSRQLNRLFQSNIGLSTKVYAQLLQFHRALNLINKEQLSISDAAFEGGYSDHAHLTRAFQRFGGFTPSDIPQDLSSPSLFS